MYSEVEGAKHKRSLKLFILQNASSQFCFQHGDKAQIGGVALNVFDEPRFIISKKVRPNIEDVANMFVAEFG